MHWKDGSISFTGEATEVYPSMVLDVAQNVTLHNDYKQADRVEFELLRPAIPTTPGSVISAVHPELRVKMPLFLHRLDGWLWMGPNGSTGFISAHELPKEVTVHFDAGEKS
jgi:hypothetical protein